MSEIKIFAFESSAVRTIDLNGEPWFVATDVSKILGFKEAKDMTRMLDDDEKGRHIVPTLGGDQEVTIINESGLYACILKSRRQEAKTFRKWITSEVLPSIRKQGIYAAPGYESQPQFITSNLSHGADLAVAADRTFRSFLRAARSAGMALPQALKMANRQTLERTGMDMLAEMELDPDAAPAVNPENQRNFLADDPLWLAVSEWAQGVRAGEYFVMAAIVEKLFGVQQSDEKFRKIAVRVGPMLRECGFRNRKTRLKDRVVNLWTKN